MHEIARPDPFTGAPSWLHGLREPDARGRGQILDAHRRRLCALDCLVEAAAQCGIRTDQERDLVTVPEEDVSLLAGADPAWAALDAAITAWRKALPLVSLAAFGFHSDAEDPFDAPSARLRRVGGGVEAIAFAGADGGIYKFFLLRADGGIGATFRFVETGAGPIEAEATEGGYRDLLEKLALIHEIGLATEIAGVTPEGFLIAKQAPGRALPPGTDVSGLEPARFIPFPSAFLRCDRDHPRLVFVDDAPWLVADTHDRNVVRDEDGSWRVIDVVAAPLPPALVRARPAFADWIARARRDPLTPALPPVSDDEL